MPSYNFVSVIGNATRDPETRQAGQATVTKFAIAVNRKIKGNNEAMYLDVEAWNKLGEVVQQYVKKGDPVHVAGRLGIRKYNNKDGVEKTVVEIVANDVTLLGGKSDGAQGGGYGGGQQRASAKAAPATEDSMLDDEIPW